MYKKYILMSIFSMLSAFASSPNDPKAISDFKVREVGNRIEVTSPWGQKSYETEFTLGAMRHYKIEIPLEDLRPAATPMTDRPETPATRDIASTPAAAAAATTPFAPSCQPPVGAENTAPTGDRKPASIPDTPSEYDSTDRLILEANHLYNRGKFYEAAVYVEELIRKNPGFVRAWVMKGSLLYVQGYSDLAKKAWAKASELDPNDPQVKDILKRYP